MTLCLSTPTATSDGRICSNGCITFAHIVKRHLVEYIYGRMHKRNNTARAVIFEFSLFDPPPPLWIIFVLYHSLFSGEREKNFSHNLMLSLPLEIFSIHIKNLHPSPAILRFIKMWKKGVSLGINPSLEVIITTHCGSVGPCKKRLGAFRKSPSINFNMEWHPLPKPK